MRVSAFFILGVTLPSFGSGYEVLSLNAATGTGVVGQVVEIPKGTVPWYIINITGSPTNAYVDIEASNDGGTTWFLLQFANITSVVNWITRTNFTSISGVTHMRARLNSFNGGTNPTATVLIGSYIETYS